MKGRAVPEGSHGWTRCARRPAPRRAVVFALCVLAASGIDAEDRVLVPLEHESWVQTLVAALDTLAKGETRAGLEVLQEGLRTSPSTLVEVPRAIPAGLASWRRALAADGPGAQQGDAAAGRRFLPVPVVVREIFAHLAPAAIGFYRELHDDHAAALFSRYADTGSTEALGVITRELFHTSHGPLAAELLGDHLFEGGLYREALSLWRRALSATRGGSSGGTDERAQGRLVEAAERVEAKIEALARRLEERPPMPSEERERLAWEVGRAGWSGELIAGDVASLSGERFRLSWHNDFWSRRGLHSDQRRHRPPRYASWFPATADFPFLPRVEGDAVYLSGVFAVFQFQGGAGRGALKATLTKPSPRHLFSHPTYQEKLTDSAFFTVTSWSKPEGRAAVRFEGLPERIVVAGYVNDRVDASKFMGHPITVELPIRSLAAFAHDEGAEDGRLLWKTGMDTTRPLDGMFVDRSGLSPKKELSYTSPALIKDGLVVAGGWVHRGYVDTLLRAHDLATGAVVWERFLSGGQLEQTLFGESAREPFACALTERDGRVYVCTQFGVVASVDLADGNVRWVATYDTIESPRTTGPVSPHREAFWGPNPPLLIGDVLIVTPRDSKYLLAIDTGMGPGGEGRGGRVLWWYDNSDRHLHDMIGAVDGAIFFTGTKSVARLELAGLEGFGGGSASPGISYRHFGEVGPGVLTSEGVVFAGTDGLFLFRPEPPGPPEGRRRLTLRGELVELLPDALGAPGRLQVAGRLLLRTTRRGLFAYEPLTPPPAR